MRRTGHSSRVVRGSGAEAAGPPARDAAPAPSTLLLAARAAASACAARPRCRAPSSAGVHRPRWTTSAMADRIWSRSRMRRTKSSTARSRGASCQRPGVGSGSREVRSTSTNPWLDTRRSSGTSSGTGPFGCGIRAMPCSASASRPVITAPGPACSRPARRRWSRLGAPLLRSTIPGQSDRHGPPGRHRLATVARCSPSASSAATRTTGSRHRAATWSGRVGAERFAEARSRCSPARPPRGGGSAKPAEFPATSGTVVG